MTNVIKTLNDLIAIDSNKKRSNQQIIDYIADRLKNFDIKKICFKKNDLNLFNLIVKIKGKHVDNPLVFVAHTDTVPSDDWQSNPFEPILKNNKIYGLGACDNKGGIATILESAKSLQKLPENDIYLLFTADEEGGGLGIKEIVKEIKFQNANIIVNEPSDGNIFIGQKACLTVKVSFFGQAQHSCETSFINNSKNSAIYKAVQAMNLLISREKEKISKYKEEFFCTSSQNIGVIQGGTTSNIVAQNCYFTVERRLLPDENIGKEFRMIKEIVATVDKKARIDIMFLGESFLSDSKNIFVKKTKSLFQKYLGSESLKFFPAWSEAGEIKNWGNAIIIGPGSLKNAHKANEFVLVRDLDNFFQIYTTLMGG